MNALDYYNKYVGYFFLENIRLPVSEFIVMIMISDFNSEARALATATHIATADEVIAIFNAQNEKWVEMCKIFEQKHGFSPVKEGAFWAEKDKQSFYKD